MGAGLAAVQANGQSNGSGGLLIAYATDPGAVAYDGKDVNSPYTSALAKHLTTPGLEIQSALTRVRAEVSDATDGAQRPWHNASLAREVFLGGEVKPQAPAPQLTLGAGAVQSEAKSDVDWTIEQKLWDEASKRNTIAHYELYLQQFPNGSFAKLASLNIDQLKASGETQVAALSAPAGEATASASQVRTAVAVPDDVKQTPGTQETEALLNLDKAGRSDLQLTPGALGHMTGGADGSLGPKSRSAIAAWQRQSGITETSYLTPQQHLFLVVQTDPMMAQVRAQYEKDKAREAAVVKPQKTTKQATAKQTTTRKQQTTQRKTTRQQVVREGPVRRQSGGGFLDSPGGAALVGGIVGGAIGGIIGSR
jgi:peptidoglycan hydrolase-like protein with peptidoglycan-binding domain